MGKLIRSQSYETLTKVKLPIVPEATTLNLDREVQLFRALVADGLSAADDKKVLFALNTIATLLAKTQRVSKVEVASKDQLHEWVQLCVSIAKEETGLCVAELERRLHAIVEEERNRPEDHE